MCVTSANAAVLIRELGSTQHLDRERSKVKLRACLRDAGVPQEADHKLQQ